uniref:Ovule protein n=1 Tax=Romanomermis culicivorax TaxID=13658 RepID=A0A915J5Z5_ROMCU
MSIGTEKTMLIPNTFNKYLLNVLNPALTQETIPHIQPLSQQIYCWTFRYLPPINQDFCNFHVSNCSPKRSSSFVENSNLFYFV